MLKVQLALEVFVLEPTLMVIGLDHRAAPLAMRERFFIGESRRYEVLRHLSSAEGIEEIVVLSIPCRTEFLIWASEPTLAANSLLHFLGTEHGLKLTEWEHFYRLLDDAALTHVFRVTAGLDSLVVGERAIVSQVQDALEKARTVGACGPFLKAVLDKAVDLAEIVHSQTGFGKDAVPFSSAAVEPAKQVFGSLEGRKLLLLGTTKTAEVAARLMMEKGAGSVVVIDQSPQRARELAESLGGRAATLADRWQCMLQADVVISATGCPHVVLSREEAERIAEERNRVALVILDIAMPRDVDPEVRRVDGILLYDLEGLERTIRNTAVIDVAAVEKAEKMVEAAARAFRNNLQAQGAVPTIVALRQSLEQLCRQELDSFIEERGPFTREQDQSLHAITAQVIQKIASSLARELKELPEKEEQERMSAAVMRLFHLESPNTALAGTILERRKQERGSKQAIAVH
ncbi:MAG: glutamyl-tRNA reductase [Terriglobales bacterium]